MKNPFLCLLTSADSLEQIEEKERKKQQELKDKEKGKRRKEEKETRREGTAGDRESEENHWWTEWERERERKKVGWATFKPFNSTTNHEEAPLWCNSDRFYVCCIRDWSRIILREMTIVVWVGGISVQSNYPVVQGGVGGMTPIRFWNMHALRLNLWPYEPKQ